MVKINSDACTGCGGRINLCLAIAISMVNDMVVVNNDIAQSAKYALRYAL